MAVDNSISAGKRAAADTPGSGALTTNLGRRSDHEEGAASGTLGDVEVWEPESDDENIEVGVVAPADGNKPIQISPDAIVRWREQVQALTQDQRDIFLREMPDGELQKYASALDMVIVDKIKTSKTLRVQKWIEPLVEIVNICKPLADSLQEVYPPAGLILGGIFFIMSMSKKAVEYQEAVVRFLTTILKNLRVMEKCKDIFPSTPELQLALIDVYGDILKFCAKASAPFIDNKGKPKSSISLLLRSQIKTFENEFGELSKSLTMHLEVFDRAVALVSGQMLIQLQQTQFVGAKVQAKAYNEFHVAEKRRVVDEQKRDTRALMKEQDERRGQLLRWISSISFQDTQDEKLDRGLEGTGRWLIDSDEFVSWKQHVSGDLLWVYGKHGSGKSHLAAQVIKILEVLCRERNGSRPENAVGVEGHAIVSDRKKAVAAPSEEAHAGKAITHDTEDDAPIPLSSSKRVRTGLDEGGTAEIALKPLENSSETKKTALAYVYCSALATSTHDSVSSSQRPHNSIENLVNNVLGSILKQLYAYLPREQDVPSLRELCFDIKADRPGRQDIRDGIKAIIPAFKQTFIVVDGLDECNPLKEVEFESLCNFLASLGSINSTGPSANVAIFSRPGYWAIEDALAGHACIQVDGGANQGDITRFIRDRTLHLTRDQSILDDIQRTLLDDAEGMFLWVSLVIDSLKDKRSANKMKTALKTMPRGLHGAYSVALLRICSQSESVRDLALRALLWTVNALEPLTNEELLEALAIEPEMDEITAGDRLTESVPLTTDCADLLVFRGGRFQPLHPSLVEFLHGLGKSIIDDGLLEYRHLQGRSHYLLAETCLTYLNMKVFKDQHERPGLTIDAIMKHYPFLKYAARNWGSHLRDCNPTGEDFNHIGEMVRELLSNSRTRGFAYGILQQAQHNYGTESLHLDATPLHFLAIYGLDRFLPLFDNVESDIHSPDGRGYFPIYYALIYKQRSMSLWILNRCRREQADKSRTSLSRGNALLLAAAWHNWPDVLRKLLELGLTENAHSTGGLVALCEAAKLGYTEIIEVLLQAGVDPNARDKDGNTAVMLAAQSQHAAAARRLMQAGADISLTNDQGATALHLVCEYGDALLTEELLDRGANINRKWLDKTSLEIAAKNDHLRIIRLLCVRGANSDSRSQAIIWSSGCGNLDAVKVLLQHGVDITTKDMIGQTALHVSARHSSTDIMTLLLQNGGRECIEMTDRVGYSPLHYAASTGSVPCVQLLVNNHAKIHCEDSLRYSMAGYSPLHLAVKEGHWEVSKILIENYGANASQKGRNGKTCMHFAALLTSTSDWVGLLAKSMVDPNPPDDDGITPMHEAAEEGNEAFARALFERIPREVDYGQQGCLLLAAKNGHANMLRAFTAWYAQDPKSTTFLGESPLHESARNGNLECMKVLVEVYPQFINSKNSSHKTPLYLACRSSSIDVVEYLLNNGADPDIDSGATEFATPLYEAVSKKQLKVAEMLIDRGANLDALEVDLWTPLHIAAFRGYHDLVAQLLDAGCEPHLLTNKGATAFSLAVQKGHGEVIDAFLSRGLDGSSIAANGGITCAQMALKCGHLDIWRKLASLNQNIAEERDSDGNDLIVFAAISYNIKMLGEILRMGFTPGSSSSYRPPLCWAADYGRAGAVQALLSAGADVNETDNYFRTALHWAVLEKNSAVAAMLIQSGASPFMRDAQGYSALDYSIRAPQIYNMLKLHAEAHVVVSLDKQRQTLARFIGRTANALLSLSPERWASITTRTYLSTYAKDMLFSLFNALAKIGRLSVGDLRLASYSEATVIGLGTKAATYCDMCGDLVDSPFYCCIECDTTALCEDCYEIYTEEVSDDDRPSVCDSRKRWGEQNHVLESVRIALSILYNQESTSCDINELLPSALNLDEYFSIWISVQSEEYERHLSNWNSYCSEPSPESDHGWQTLLVLQQAILQGQKTHLDISLEGMDSVETFMVSLKSGTAVNNLASSFERLYESNEYVSLGRTMFWCKDHYYLEITEFDDLDENYQDFLGPKDEIRREFIEFLAKKYARAASSLYTMDSYEDSPSAFRISEEELTFGHEPTEVKPSHKPTNETLPLTSPAKEEDWERRGDKIQPSDLDTIRENLLGKREMLMAKSGGLLTSNEELTFEAAWRFAQAITSLHCSGPPLANMDREHLQFVTAPSSPVATYFELD